MRRLFVGATAHPRPSSLRGVDASLCLPCLVPVRACASGPAQPPAPPPAPAVRASAKAPPPRHPMEWLSMVFQQHPSALRLHRELTIALAEGDSERAADLAAVLASTVRRVSDELEGSAAAAAATTTTEPAETADDRDALPPRPVPEEVQTAMEKTREALEAAQRRSGARGAVPSSPTPAEHADPATAAASSPSVQAPFWRQSENLCLTLLESAFETDVPDESSSPLTEAGLRAEKHERQQMEILDQYLTTEAARWKAQKEAVLHTVLHTAQRLQLTPEEIHVHESTRPPRRSGAAEAHLNVLKHANLLIRGEVPALAFGEQTSPSSDTVQVARAELDVLKTRMAQQGSPLSASEEEMALYELVMAKSTVRYLVGLHHDLEAAINASAGVRAAWEATDAASRARFPTPAAFFVSSVMERLHPALPLPDVLGTGPTSTMATPDGAATEEAQELSRAIATPVLPFTFMLKTCLWFTTDSATADI